MNCNFSDDFKGNKNSLIRLKLLILFFYTNIFTHIYNINSAVTRHLFSMFGSKIYSKGQIQIILEIHTETAIIGVL